MLLTVTVDMFELIGLILAFMVAGSIVIFPLMTAVGFVVLWCENMENKDGGFDE